MRNFFMIFSISFLICTFLAGCSENDDSIPELLDDNWEKKTITKIVENGYADGMFVDYSEANKISYTMDDLWRTLEIYNSIGYNYQQDLLLEKIINLELNGLKEELQFSYLCFKYLDNGCSIEIEINPTIEEILNREYDTMETLDLVYFIVSYYYDNINNNSKINIMKWIESNATVIKKDIGLIYTVLSIQDKMGVEIIEFENRELYKHLLKNTIEEPDSDLIELYYLYFINYYLQNEIDENYVFTGVLKYFDQDSGFSLSKHYYLDANLGTFIAINILNEIGKIGSLKKDIMTIAEKLETNYGLFINKENIPTGTIEETIMGYYVLQILGEVKSENTKLINQYKDNEISWFWTYYDLVQAGKNVSEDEIKIINDRLNIFEKEFIVSSLSDEVYKMMLESSGMLNEIEYFTRVGQLLDYPFQKDYKEKVKKIVINLIEIASEDNADIISNVLYLDSELNLDIDFTDVKNLINELSDKEKTNNFFENYSIVKLKKHVNKLEKSEILSLFEDHMNSQGGVNSDSTDKSSDTLFTVFLMLSLASNY